jgi:D-sedoheptulose 7-phosphate isomerase
LYIAGNGGSAADAQHLAAEFVSKLARDRAPLAAEALTVDSSIITFILKECIIAQKEGIVPLFCK